MNFQLFQSFILKYILCIFQKLDKNKCHTLMQLTQRNDSIKKSYNENIASLTRNIKKVRELYASYYDICYKIVIFI